MVYTLTIIAAYSFSLKLRILFDLMLPPEKFFNDKTFAKSQERPVPEGAVQILLLSQTHLVGTRSPLPPPTW
jgi:hypothetical protein